MSDPRCTLGLMVRIVVGDATAPQAEGPVVIAHVCNDVGKWGRGFVQAISARWPEPKRAYRQWYRAGLALGEVQIVQCEPGVWVANMIGQRGIARAEGDVPIRYDAVEQCLRRLAVETKLRGASVHMPRIGCGLAGGSWEKIGPMVEDALAGIEVIVYDLAADQ